MLFEAIGTAEVWSTHSESQKLRLSHPPCSTKAYRVLVSPSSVSSSLGASRPGAHVGVKDPEYLSTPPRDLC